MVSPEVVELRCETNPARLFARLLSDGKPVVSQNLFEFKCRDCAKKVGGGVAVFHRFDVAGELVETEVVASTLD